MQKNRNKKFIHLKSRLDETKYLPRVLIVTIICSIKEFNARTKPVRDAFELDIIPDTRLGLFLRDRFEELIQYCRQHPRYHIISVLPKSAIKINRPVKDAALYLLGEGDDDPELVYGSPTSMTQFEHRQLRKFDTDQ